MFGKLGRRRLLAPALAGVLAVGVIGGGAVALAQTPGSDGGSTPTAADHARHPRLAAIGIREVAKVAGLTKEQLAAGAKAGKSLNQVITDAGGNPGTVQAQVLADVKAKLDQAVANKTITQDRADKAYAKAQQALPKLMAATPKAPGDRHGQGRKGVVRHAAKAELGVAAKTIGIDEKTLLQELKGGKTVAQVATAHNIAPQTVIDAMVAAANTKIDQAAAAGHIPADKVADAKAKAKAAITKFVNEGGPRHQ